MAKASVIRPDGTKVTIEGSEDEVAALLQRMEGASSQSSPKPRQRRVRAKTPSSRKATSSSKPRPKGPADYIRDLKEEDFFKGKRGIAEVRDKLEEQAHIYPVTTLSPALFRLVKAKELRRIKEDGQWKYVNP